MKLTVRTTLIATLLALALAACGGGEAPSAAEPTAAPAAAPTSAAAESEAKPRPTAAAQPTVPPAPTAEPTAAPSASGSGAGIDLAGAIANAKDVKTYRMEMTMSSAGLLDAMAQAGGTSSTPTGADVPLISMAGEFDNPNAHFTMKGLFAGFLGVDPEQGMETLSVDGKSYLRGPIPLLGATEDAWYVADASQSSVTQPPVDTNQFFDAFGGEDLSKFEQVGSETLDGRACTIYKGDEAATQAVFQSAAGGSGSSGMDNIDSAKLKIWACDDSYVHQMEINMVGSSSDKPDQKLDFKMNFHLYDFNSEDIAITAPENPQTLQTPSYDLPTSEP